MTIRISFFHRLAVTSALALSVLLAGETANAQSPLCSGDVFQEGSSAIKGTVSDQLMGAALRRNAQIYGAANAVQTKLLPMLANLEKGGAAMYDGTVTWGALRVPFCPPPNADVYDLSQKPRMTKVDMSTVTMGLAYKHQSVVFYLAGSASMHSAAGGKEAMRAALPMLTVGAFTYLPVGFFKREIVYDDLSIIWDYIAGVQMHAPVGEIAFGYLGSKGMFTNVSERHIKAFVGAVLNDFTNGAGLPYLAGGIQSFDWAVPKDVVDKIGSTGLSARRLVYPSAPPPQLAASDVKDAEKQVIPFVTAYFEQTGIGKVLDITLAAQHQSKFEPYEMTVAFHNPGYGKRPEKSDTRDDFKSGVRLTAGTVKLPNLWFYGVEGGYKVRAALEATIQAEGQYITFGLGVNSPSILAAFPYAYNAVQLTMSLNGW